MARKKESEFEKLARLIKEEGEEIRGEMKEIEKRLDMRFSGLEHKIEAGIQPQLTDHSRRIGALELKTSRR